MRLYETPRFEDEAIVLTGYGLEDVEDHRGGEDERRRGVWLVAKPIDT
jgi:hypothetical protein